MDLRQHPDDDGVREEALRVVCGWCGRLMRGSADTGALTSHGICATCARVLEGASGDKIPASGAAWLSTLEGRTNQLMCRLYESKQMLLDIQHRVRHDGELMGRVGQALASIRRQEIAVADIQRCIVLAQDDPKYSC